MTLKEAYDFAKTEEGISFARQFLSRVREKEGHLLLLYARLEDMKKNGLSLSSPSLHEIPVQVSGTGDRTGEWAARLCDLEIEIEKELKEVTLLKNKRKEMIEDIEDEVLRKALIFYYLEHLTAVAAAQKMYMDERTFFRKLRRGCIQIAMRLCLSEEKERSCVEKGKML